MSAPPKKRATKEALLVNPNVLQIDEARGLHDQSTPLSLRCPHCLQIGMFENALRREVTYQKQVYYPENTAHLMISHFQATVRLCPNPSCEGLVLAVTRNGKVTKSLPSAKLNFDTEGIPPALIETLQEAIECHGAGAYRAAAMMVRRLMEELCEEHKAVGNNLHQRLLDLRTKVPLSVALLDGAMELKVLGNDAAHVIAKEYATIGAEEAEVSIEVAKEILKALYQHQNLVGRLQKLKGAPT